MWRPLPAAELRWKISSTFRRGSVAFRPMFFRSLELGELRFGIDRWRAYEGVCRADRMGIIRSLRGPTGNHADVPPPGARRRPALRTGPDRGLPGHLERDVGDGDEHV